jgi:predicted AAA+ superfamily ATPase
MIPRRCEGVIRDRLGQFPAVALLGARQVGKTTLAGEIAAALPQGDALYLDLERSSDLARLAEAELFLGRNRNRLVVLDEVQRAPGLFATLRTEIDADSRPGRFLLLGSASPELLRQSSESLAGRIAFVELSGLTVDEVHPDFPGLQTLWLRGGFPRSYLAENDDLSFVWRGSFVTTFLERDLPQLGIQIPAPTLHRFWRMLAHHQAQLWNASQLGSALGVAHSTVQRYLDVLQAALVIRRLEPLHANLSKRLIKSPKAYVRDSGLLHALLGVRTVDELQGTPIAGASWEGFVLEQILSSCALGTDFTFYRTVAGAELDLVLRRANTTVGVEIKFSTAPKPTKGFWQALEDLGVARAYVIAPVREPYPLASNVEVISPLHLALLR